MGKNIAMLGSQLDGMLNIGVDKMDEAEARLDFFWTIVKAKDKVGESDNCGDGSGDVGEEAYRFNHRISRLLLWGRSEFSTADYSPSQD